MSDLFHDAVPAEFVHDVWAAMQSTPQHTYQVLTKRPDRMASITSSLPVLKNVWLGTSVESAEYVDRIVKGAKPADLPVQEPVRFDFVVNLRAARLLGISLSPGFIGSADEVIE